MVCKMSIEQESILTNIIKNMTLAHEMVITDNFHINHVTEQQENSLEKHVHNIVHTAFWDVLKSQLDSSPPEYDKAINLLMEMKEMILELIPKNQQALSKEINETLDVQLIRQQVLNQGFDIKSCSRFVIDKLSKLCAPARDEDVQRLRELNEIVPILRGSLELLNLMKLDLANFQLMSLKPILLKQAAEYEREKFDEYLKENPDGLSVTKSWLNEAYVQVKQMKETTASGDIVIAYAYLSLLRYNQHKIYPETLLMDEVRINSLSESYEKLSFQAAILSLYANFIGKDFSEDHEFMKGVRDSVGVLIGTNPRNNELMLNVHEYLNESYNKEATKKNISQDKDSSELKLQIESLSNEGNIFREVIVLRIRDNVLMSMSVGRCVPTKEGHVLHLFHEQQKELTDFFLRIVTHNKRVHRERYNQLIEAMRE